MIREQVGSEKGLNDANPDCKCVSSYYYFLPALLVYPLTSICLLMFLQVHTSLCICRRSTLLLLYDKEVSVVMEHQWLLQFVRCPAGELAFSKPPTKLREHTSITPADFFTHRHSLCL